MILIIQCPPQAVRAGLGLTASTEKYVYVPYRP
jgi:hypothetical protein